MRETVTNQVPGGGGGKFGGRMGFARRTPSVGEVHKQKGVLIRKGEVPDLENKFSGRG